MMFSKLSKHSSVKRILVISLSNIGDVILTAPVIDILLRDFPLAQFTLVIGPKAQTLFADHPRIGQIIYNKHMPILKQVEWFLNLRKNYYDVIIDLRQSALGVLLAGRWRTPMTPTKIHSHMRLKHIQRLKSVYNDFLLPSEMLSIIPKFFEGRGALNRYVVIAPGAADSAKRWLPSGFAQVADVLASQNYQVVFVGNGQDEIIIRSIQSEMKNSSISLSGDIDLRELAFIVKRAQLVLSNDSAAMHMASYFNVPVVALWGPTDMNQYGPWSSKYETVINRQGCLRCLDPKSSARHQCMDAIAVKDVLNAIKLLQ